MHILTISDHVTDPMSFFVLYLNIYAEADNSMVSLLVLRKPRPMKIDSILRRIVYLLTEWNASNDSKEAEGHIIAPVDSKDRSLV